MSHTDSNGHEDPDIEEFISVFLEEIKHKIISGNAISLITVITFSVFTSVIINNIPDVIKLIMYYFVASIMVTFSFLFGGENGSEYIVNGLPNIPDSVKEISLMFLIACLAYLISTIIISYRYLDKIYLEVLEQEIASKILSRQRFFSLIKVQQKEYGIHLYPIFLKMLILYFFICVIIGTTRDQALINL